MSYTSDCGTRYFGNDMFGTVIHESVEGIATVTLNRPVRTNAFNELSGVRRARSSAIRPA